MHRAIRLLTSGVVDFGALAQLVERFHGMEEVRGSIPLGSTRFFWLGDGEREPKREPQGARAAPSSRTMTDPEAKASIVAQPRKEGVAAERLQGETLSGFTAGGLGIEKADGETVLLLCVGRLRDAIQLRLRVSTIVSA